MFCELRQAIVSATLLSMFDGETVRKTVGEPLKRITATMLT
jgi:hypothetical protein